MATIKLTSFHTHEKNRPCSPIVVENLPTFGKIQWPTTALTTLFGFKESLEAKKNLINAAESRRLVWDTIDIEVEVGVKASGRITLEPPAHWNGDRVGSLVLADRKMIHMDRLTEPVASIANEIFLGAYEREGYAWTKESRPFKRSIFSLPYPHLIDDIHKHPLFNHLDVIIYRCEDINTGASQQVAALFNADVVIGMESGKGRKDIVLPDWLPRRGSPKPAEHHEKVA